MKSAKANHLTLSGKDDSDEDGSDEDDGAGNEALKRNGVSGEDDVFLSSEYRDRVSSFHFG